MSLNKNILGVIVLFLVVSIGIAVSKGGIDAGILSDSQKEAVTVNDTESPRPNIILITLESVRSQNIGTCYGYSRLTAPNICGVAEDGVIFKNTYSQGTATTVALPSIVTGDLPVAVARNDIGNPVLEGATTVVEKLDSEGYRTYGFFDTVQGELIKSPLLQDLDSLTGWRTTDVPRISAVATRREPPRFIWVFARNRTHKSYDPAPALRRWESLPNSVMLRDVITSSEELENSSLTRKDLIAIYDEAILTEDKRLGELISSLKKKGAYRDSMIIITGDHGEAFGAYGNVGHGDEPIISEIKVPLIIKFPGNRYSGEVVEKPVRHMDIVPTVYDYLGVNYTDKKFGKSLLPLLEGEERYLPVVSARLPLTGYTIKSGGTKVILRNAGRVCPENIERNKWQLFIEQKPENMSVNEVKIKASTHFVPELCDIYNRGMQRRFDNLKE